MPTPANRRPTARRVARCLAPLAALLLGMAELLPAAPAARAAQPSAVHSGGVLPAALAAAISPKLDTVAWSSTESDNTISVAWGDVDGDGDLDLAVGNDSQPSRLYRNDNGVLTTSAVWSSAESDSTQNVAWGDYDGDGDLDLATGNRGQPNRLYRNDNGVLTTSAVWSSAESDSTQSVAWGDYDGDGDLDLAVGNDGQPNRLYRNGNGVLTSSAVWSSTESDRTTSVAWGDVDGDGDLDLATGNFSRPTGPNRLYRNDNGVLTSSAVWSSTESSSTTSVAWGDVDGDGDLDLAVGNFRQPNRLYRNDNGVLTSSAVWSSAESDLTASVAWGDYDGDGDLDLATGNFDQPNRLYRNDNGVLTSSAAWSSTESDRTSSVAWGDVDGDGDPDLAVGIGTPTIFNAIRIFDSPNRLYRNDNSFLASSAIWSSTGSDSTQSVAWGDVDGDGDLDLAVGKDGQPIQLYRDDNGVLTSNAIWSSAASASTSSLAWGDVDGDGDLDLVAGNNGSQLYRNNNGVLTNSAVWSSAESDQTISVAWGDVDGDGDLDLATGNFNQPNRLYRNDNGVLTSGAVWSSAESDQTTSVAWGDVDGDDDLDLIVGNLGQPIRLYRNDNGVLTSGAVWSSAESNVTASVAWGDYDGDGDLDLATGNNGSQLYRNDNGVLTNSAVWSSAERDNTRSVAWGDYDGDGDLDLATGNFNQPNRLYRNDNGVLTSSAAWSSAESDQTTSAAWGDIDGDGDLDLAVGNDGQPNRLYRNTHDAGFRLSAVPIASMQQPDSAPPLGSANFYASGHILDQQLIPIKYTLVQSDSLPVGQVIGQYSLDGGDHWRTAAPAAATQTTNLASSPGGSVHTYTWDTFADSDADKGVFGQSDNVVFRLIALPDLRGRANRAAGPYQYGGYSAASLPFRVRGTQPRVLRDGNPVAGALVYRLPGGEVIGAQPLADRQGKSYRTNTLGYLQGRNPIAPGDTLAALQPITTTTSYTLYYSSAAPNASGLTAPPITSSGVQTVTISPANPLMLLNLSVSLEWDARKDGAFLTRLQTDLQRASAQLYDWSDGQVALGPVTIYQNREHWFDQLDALGNLLPGGKGADIRISASNRLRPNATQGGITSADRPDPAIAGLTYEFGHVRIGAVWNRDGGPIQQDTDDWARALAHELGHYALFLDDNYLGLDAQRRLVSVESCPGAMSDPYVASGTEFRPRAGWLPGCASTLANQTTGRADWETIKAFYDNAAPGFTLNQPAAFGANPGPSVLPLAVTQITVVPPGGSAALSTQSVDLANPDTTDYAPSPTARAFLLSADGARLTDLGQPVNGQVVLRGATTGDRLCLYDLAPGRLGCTTASAVTPAITVGAREDWQPDVIITPVTSRTLTLEVLADGVGAPAPAKLTARLFPSDSSQAAKSVDLLLAGGSYTGTLTLPAPALEGLVRIIVPNDTVPGGSAPAREVISSYSLGGNPAPPRRPRRRQRRRAPVTSADGQVVLYSDDLTFDQSTFFFYSLQTATRVPDGPERTALAGPGYRLIASDASRLQKVTIDMTYADGDVPASWPDAPGLDPEKGIAVYYLPRGGTRWQRLAGTLDVEHNEVTAPVQGPGLYALMASHSRLGLPLIRR